MKKDITMNSTVGEVWNTPIGHDILQKLLQQSGLSDKVITNPIVSKIKLSSAKKLVKNQFDEGFWDALIHLVNSEKDEPYQGCHIITPKWWKEAVFYQVYPRTFFDTNQDGIGDLQGVRNKVPYLKELGINAIWLSPIYDSPMDDNGYDIRDYRKIHSDFGTMEDFDRLLEDVHKSGMKLIMDLVVNHTSDEHRWFQDAIHHPDSEYRDYYFLRPNSEEPPNNWTSFFSGSVWDKYGENQDWALHLFTKKQIDLNWDNPKVRRGVEDMVNWWLEKGVDGFRLDVTNYISKEEGLPDGDVSVGDLMCFYGLEHYYYGPHLHEYFRELNQECFSKYNAFSVGETPGLGMKMSQLVTAEERHELDMVFSFDQLENPGKIRWDDYRYDLNFYRDAMIEWMEGYGDNCWFALFYNNHDNPRMVSKIDPTHQYDEEIQELLVAIQMTLKGTPFIFQGDEMGLTNVDFKDMSEINDVESINYYQELLQKGKTEEEAWKTILSGSRDQARTMLPWNEGARQTANPKITEIYRNLIALRANHPCLIYGDFKVLSRKKNRFVYERSNEQESWIIDCNLSSTEVNPYPVSQEYVLVWPQQLHGTKLNSYGVRIWKKQK